MPGRLPWWQGTTVEFRRIKYYYVGSKKYNTLYNSRLAKVK